jgi:Sec-independent protein translocase protein TatA
LSPSFKRIAQALTELGDAARQATDEFKRAARGEEEEPEQEQGDAAATATSGAAEDRPEPSK